MLLTFSQEIQAADTERRIVSGLVAPYGEVGYTSAGPVVFERGSIAIPDASKIKLLSQHQQDKPVGRAISFSDSTEGVYGSFKLSSSTRGQDALVLAQENLVSGLSVGVDVTASKPMGDYLLVTAAVLKEVSLVESAAFSSASVTDIAAARAALEAATSTSMKEKTTTINTVIVEIEKETETEMEEAVTTAPENTPEETPVDAPVEAEKVEAARKIIRPSVLDSQRVRTPITSMASYTEHKIKAALGDDTSKLYVTAADDSFTTNPAFSPTQYLTEFVSNTNFDTPMINALSSGTLPNSGMTIQIPSLVTSAGGGNGVAPVVTVEAEAGAVQNTGMVTEYLSGTVKKYAGMNTLSVELLERSDPNFYAELTNQLQRAYSLATDAAVIADVVAGGVQGTAVAATSAGIISYVSTESANIYKNTSYFAKNYVAGPSQWSLLMGATDSTGRPIYNASAPMNSGGLSTPTSIRGNVLGLDLYVDHQMVSTTIDDSAFIVAPEAMTVYRSPQAYMSVNVVSNLQVQVAIYGFMATIVKMPKGLVRYNLT
ncbi:Phage major capsid protein, HK97 [uncultured Caudovirales phage]|uniref:Phage major capsid protein, HK97 n=1 Tax=uncultured Caudovirales phage TaxID=2100421 RepID=A0A6J5NS04_9CAUD|nr:Phage major capsid protein, HK97 [uncultured Caudovirales phage]